MWHPNMPKIDIFIVTFGKKNNPGNGKHCEIQVMLESGDSINTVY